LRLARLTMHHPDAEEIAAVLGPLLPKDCVQFMPSGEPRLVAIFDGPQGTVRLE